MSFTSKSYDFLVIGAGIFGINTAIELKKRKYTVAVLNPDRIPHLLAASTDISKIVRMEYGSDELYTEMAEISIKRWRTWNDLLGSTLYHETGLLMLSKEEITDSRNQYEYASIKNIQKRGYKTERLSAKAFSERFPTFNVNNFKAAHYNATAGFAESSKAVARLIDYARSLKVDVFEGQTAQNFGIEKGNLHSVHTQEGITFNCGHAIVAAGANTLILLPELQPYMKATGHPVFWLKPKDPSLFTYPKLTVFMADISNTGWYGFPYLPDPGVVKIARHTNGLTLDPEKDDRHIAPAEVADMRAFLSQNIPTLANAPLVYTRRCLYTDTLDGHYWIDHHPTINGLSVCSGGSGHGFKMGPIIGEITADMVERKENRFLHRFKWRHLNEQTTHSEESRNMIEIRGKIGKE